MMRPTVILGALLALGSPLATAAQSVWAGGVLQTYTISDAPVSAAREVQQLTLPVSAAWGRGALGVEIRSAYTDAIVTFGGGGYVERAGPVDTRVAASYALGRILVSGFADLATGDAQYRIDELPLLGALGSDLLPVAGTTWGRGGAVGGEVAVRGTSGESVYTFGAGYLRSSAFEPLVGIGAGYRPGDQLRVRAAIDTRFGEASVLSGYAGYQRFSGDALDGANVYRAGARWEAEFALTHPLGAREGLSVSAGMYRRAGGALIQPDSVAPVPGLTSSPDRMLVTVAAEAQATRGRVTLAPELRARVLRTGDDVGSGWLASVGARAQYRVAGGRYGARLLVTPSARLHLGSVSPVAGAASAVRGWEVGVSARWGP